ncbi:Glucitol operon repressor [bioreactor metagenome]|uniref:Glucitol operon repressor n=1 Tax=bioreactor metagenome TaxID=1076179 RepID=A0A645DQX0_9ZZZZ|nr:DeoR/GlpR family DNA-binding transcription regulator [Erysipelotrichaceae bacterium]
MNVNQRRMGIYDLLIKDKNVEVMELARLFNVSSMTIRRDLTLFEKQGLVTTTYGGAYLNQSTTTEASFQLKATQMADEKTRIGQFASRYVQENDTIIIDCGSTALQLAKALPNIKLTVITNSWPLINFLGSNTKIRLILAPGTYNSVSAGALDGTTAAFFKNINADKVFISTQGCDLVRGLTVPEMLDAEVKRSMLNAGRKKYLLLDHTKIGLTYLAKHASLEEFDQIIVDQDIDPELWQNYQKKCPKLVRAE